MSRRRLIIIAVLSIPIVFVVGIAILGLCWYVSFSHRFHLASQHVPIISEMLKADGRFSKVRAYPHTSDGGCLLIIGEIPPGTTAELKRLVESTSPPVFVKYAVDENKNTQPAGSPADGKSNLRSAHTSKIK